MFHLYSGQPLIEPIGGFSGSGYEWDITLTAASTSATALISFRLIVYFIKERSKDSRFEERMQGGTYPAWYPEARKWLWLGTAISILVLNAANVLGGFYQVGINTKWVLIFPLNLLASWLINIGFGIAIACLAYWEYMYRSNKLLSLLFAAFLEALISSITSISRSMFLFRTLPYLLVLAQNNMELSRRRKALILLAFIAFFVTSLVSVSLFRVPMYYKTPLLSSEIKVNIEASTQPSTQPGTQPSTQPGTQPSTQPSTQPGTQPGTQPSTQPGTQPSTQPGTQPSTQPGTQPSTQPDSVTPSHEGILKTTEDSKPLIVPSSKEQPLSNEVVKAVPSEKVTFSAKAMMLNQIRNLFVKRWIGLEGVMAVTSSHQNSGSSYLMDGLLESPRKGVNSIYQKLSHSFYQKSDEYTFLTLPGITAILYYSNSYMLIYLGVLFTCLLMMITEQFIRRFIRNPFLLSLVGLSMANVLCQMNFPYLAFVFFAELWVALLGIWFIQEKLNRGRIARMEEGMSV